jgi:hypothetical protein
VHGFNPEEHAMLSRSFKLIGGLLLGGAVAAWAQQVPATPEVSPFPEQAQPLSAEALKGRLEGKVFATNNPNGSTSRLEFQRNGWAYLDVSTGFRDSGRWRTEADSQVCVAWRSAGEVCSPVRQLEEQLWIRGRSGHVLRLTER